MSLRKGRSSARCGGGTRRPSGTPTRLTLTTCCVCSVTFWLTSDTACSGACAQLTRTCSWTSFRTTTGYQLASTHARTGSGQGRFRPTRVVLQYGSSHVLRGFDPAGGSVAAVLAPTHRASRPAPSPSAYSQAQCDSGPSSIGKKARRTETSLGGHLPSRFPCGHGRSTVTLCCEQLGARARRLGWKHARGRRGRLLAAEGEQTNTVSGERLAGLRLHESACTDLRYVARRSVLTYAHRSSRTAADSNGYRVPRRCRCRWTSFWPLERRM